MVFMRRICNLEIGLKEEKENKFKKLPKPEKRKNEDKWWNFYKNLFIPVKSKQLSKPLA